MSLTREDLKNEIEKMSEEVLRDFKKTGSIPTMFIATKIDGEKMIVFTPWRDEKEKDQTLTALKDVFATNHVQFYLMISEVWYKKFDSDEDYKNREHNKQPSEYEDKSEGFQIAGSTINGLKAMKGWQILKTDKGEISEIKEVYNTDDLQSLGGRMFELLEQTN